MTEIKSDGKTYAAAADMVIKQGCGIMSQESRYALHPSCIDSCLQLFIVAIYAGKLGDIICGTALTHFQEVSIWPPTGSQLDNAQGRAYAFTTMRGNRAFLCNAQLVSHDAELVADFANIRCVSYEAAIPQKTQQGSRQDQIAQLEWKPDIAYLERPREEELNSQSYLAYIVDLYAKHGLLNILCLDSKIIQPSLNAVRCSILQLPRIQQIRCKDCNISLRNIRP
jgi:Polyketide synthase dehydratase